MKKFETKKTAWIKYMHAIFFGLWTPSSLLCVGGFDRAGLRLSVWVSDLREGSKFQDSFAHAIKR